MIRIRRSYLAVDGGVTENMTNAEHDAVLLARGRNLLAVFFGDWGGL